MLEIRWRQQKQNDKSKEEKKRQQKQYENVLLSFTSSDLEMSFAIRFYEMIFVEMQVSMVQDAIFNEFPEMSSIKLSLSMHRFFRFTKPIRFCSMEIDLVKFCAFFMFNAFLPIKERFFSRFFIHFIH